MFYVREFDTNFSSIPTLWIEEDFDTFVKKWDLEVVERNEKTATVRAEWGNNEGYDTFEIEFAQTIPLDDYFAMVLDELPGIVAEYPSLEAFAKSEFEKEHNPEYGDFALAGTQLDMVN